jgi:nucleoside-diphosphate-sugar epimerase
MQISKVLVLGATGRIGAILRNCWPAGRARWQTRTIIPKADVNPDTWAVLDPLTEPDALAHAAQGCSTILCLAGVTPARAAVGSAMDANLSLANAAIQAGAATDARVLLASSAAIYGAQSGTLTEDMPPTPVSDYGRAKAAMEMRGVELGARLGVPVTALRIGNIAGFDAILGKWAPGFWLDCFSDGHTPARSYIGPLTLARVLGDLVMARDLPGVLNIAAPGAVEMGALLDAAGFRWTPRTPAVTTIAEVHLSVAALERITPFAPADSCPETMIAEWRELRPDTYT